MTRMTALKIKKAGDDPIMIYIFFFSDHPSSTSTESHDLWTTFKLKMSLLEFWYAFRYFTHRCFFVILCLHLLIFQLSSVAQSCPTLCNPMNRSAPGLPVHHQLPEFIQTLVHRVGDAIQPSHPQSSPSPPAPNPSQHHSLFQCVNSSHEVARVLQLQL